MKVSRDNDHQSQGNPTFIEAGIVNYCVTNTPGAVARTSYIRA